MHQEDKWLPEEFKIYSVDENDGVIYWKGKKKKNRLERNKNAEKEGGKRKTFRRRRRRKMSRKEFLKNRKGCKGLKVSQKL